MSAPIVALSVVLVMALIAMCIHTLFKAYCAMDTDPHDELVIDYDDPYCPNVRAISPSRYHVATRIREIITALSMLPDGDAAATPFIEEVASLQVDAIHAGWITEEALSKALFSADVFSKGFSAGYLAMLAWFADTLERRGQQVAA